MEIVTNIVGCVCPLVFVALFAYLGRSMGQRKTIGPTGGLLLGLFGGFIGIFILMFLPNKKNPRRDRLRNKRRREPVRQEELNEEIYTNCPHCNKKFIIRDLSKAGKKVRCSRCQTIFRVPC